MDGDKKINFYGHIAKMPNDVKAVNSIKFLENIKISKQKLWYILIQKQDNELQMIKYNNRAGVNIKLFIENLKIYYEKNEKMIEYISNLEIIGENKFSVIRNIPDVEIDGKKLITIITEDLIKLLS